MKWSWEGEVEFELRAMTVDEDGISLIARLRTEIGKVGASQVTGPGSFFKSVRILKMIIDVSNEA